jgi:hypothetical protein
LEDEQTGGHPDRQTDDINGGKDFILADIPPGGGEITLKHVPGFIPTGRNSGRNVASI